MELESPNGTLIEWLERTDSTNSWLKRNNDLSDGCTMKVAATRFQECGRGQQGNSWESEPGSNLLFSILTRPGFIGASEQFCISQAISLAVTDAIIGLYPEIGNELSIKWPNDIYWNNMKVAGILIENSLQGHFIADSIIGVGLNVNQLVFHSDAPNPISLRRISGREGNCSRILETIVGRFTDYLGQLKDNRIEDIHCQYMKRLFRSDGYYPYRDSEGSFTAAISSVRPNGILVLTDSEGRLRKYEFKQVSYILNK